MNPEIAASDPPLPRVLLVEDDPVSAGFLSEALAALPARVDVAATLAEATALAETTKHDLWLIDAHLPDGAGAELLSRLRSRGYRTPALAHTAETATTLLDILIDAGFEEVLIKPLSIAMLHGAVQRVLRMQAHGDVDRHAPSKTNTSITPMLCGKFPIWDDAAALRALNGNVAHVEAMRGLYRSELPQVQLRTVAALRDENLTSLDAELHKLRASSGFVGAARLGAAAQALQANPRSIDARRQFEGALQDTLSSA